ncbi:subtilisin family serine protease [Azospirillum baldaniorum]|uniref:S8 family peptidase n=1 Tax=Azospirillum baldaniorum TaxID=1064539 RepID=UPI00119E6F09|nr:S8 family serine peptidase [Azospirillum baldaniorum]TWA66336.1 subtilisin family serine protease [Azospirillum baldaniorum]
MSTIESGGPQEQDGSAQTRAQTLLREATIPLGEGVAGRRPARYAVKLDGVGGAGTRPEELAAVFSPEPVRIEPLSPSDPDVFLLVFPHRSFSSDTTAVFELGYLIDDVPGVSAAEPDIATDFYPDPDQPRRLGEESADGFMAGCWVGEDSGLPDARWALKAIRAPEAWAWSDAQGRPSRGERIVVAQPDTGVVRHKELDLERRVASFDVLDRDRDPEDPLNYRGNTGHGTATGSVVVSGGNNAMSGCAPRAYHMPIRCIESVVRVSQVPVAQAIDFAVDNGAHVVTMSLGGLPSFTLARALARAVAADVIVMAAAGNCVGTVVWPARYDACIAVAGVNKDDLRWKGSCRGYGVDVSAPAENVYRARPDGASPTVESSAVGQGEGTSYAVALTAGVAALWLAHHGRANLVHQARLRGETLQDMFSRLLKATARRPPDWDAANFGAGIVDAEALLKAHFDLGRGREGAFTVSVDPALPVRALVAERLGPTAVDPQLDYDRYGPELAFHLLEEARGRPTPGGGAEEAGSPGTPPTGDLRDAVTNPELRAHLERRA